MSFLYRMSLPLPACINPTIRNARQMSAHAMGRAARFTFFIVILSGLRVALDAGSYRDAARGRRNPL
jgi:hypothetical protein